MNKNRILVLFGMLVVGLAVVAIIVPTNAGSVQVVASPELPESPEVVDLSQLSLTQAGEDLNFLNKKLGEKMGLEEGPLEFTAVSCRQESETDLILSEEPCLRLYGVKDKTLEENSSHFVLFFYNHYYPQKSEFDGSEIACGEGGYDPINCLGSEAVVSPFFLRKETSSGLCAFAQDSDHKVEIIEALHNEAELVTDLYFNEEFSGCAMLSPKTVQAMEYYGFSQYSY